MDDVRMGSWLISSLYISLQPLRLPRSLPCTLRLLSYRYATPTGRMTETNEGMNRDKECKKRGNERMNGM